MVAGGLCFDVKFWTVARGAIPESTWPHGSSLQNCSNVPRTLKTFTPAWRKPRRDLGRVHDSAWNGLDMFGPIECAYTLSSRTASLLRSTWTSCQFNIIWEVYHMTIIGYRTYNINISYANMWLKTRQKIADRMNTAYEVTSREFRWIALAVLSF